MNRKLLAVLGIILQACLTAPSPIIAQSNEPAGMKPIIDISFGSKPLSINWQRAPQPQIGLTLGQAEGEIAHKIIPGRSGAANDYAYRCVFPVGSQAGKGVGCTLYLKESDPYNSDGNTKHSYRTWYERGYFRFGNVDASGNILPVFEDPAVAGMKLLGYWGVGCKGNVQAIGLIGWMAPSPRASTGSNKPVSKWTYELRTQICGGLSWTKYSSYVVLPGNTWHPYEVLMDAGTPGKTDGSIKMWIDGTQVLNAAVQMRTTTNPRGFFGRHWNPVQGGGCPPAPASCARSNRGVLDIDDIYISVANPVD